MYPAEFDYFSPRTLDEALALLSTYGEEAKVLAGGQSLLPMMKLRMAAPRCLVDVNGIDELRGIRREGDRLVFGALCRHAEAAASPLVRERLPIMVDAAALTADVQVRNRGTLAGSLAHADPAGDWPAALMALDTVLVVAGPGGRRSVPLREFVLDAYTTQLGTAELVVAVSVSLPPPGSGGAYVKFERRAGDFAVASAGVQLVVEGAECTAVAISLGAVGPAPIRVAVAEQRLLGGPPDPERLAGAERLVREAAQPFEDTRGSVEYKRHLAGVLFRRAWDAAHARALGRTVATLHP